MATWVQVLEGAALVALAVHVWRLTKRVRRLEEASAARSGAPPPGSFATLVKGYLELLSRSREPGGAEPPRRVAGVAPSETTAAGYRGVGREEPSAAPGPTAPRLELPPGSMQAVELLRQGLDAREVARRLGMGLGEVQVVERLARARGLL